MPKRKGFFPLACRGNGQGCSRERLLPEIATDPGASDPAANADAGPTLGGRTRTAACGVADPA